ncbi:hypothetical protein EW145_g4104 [Phellinidium pouzarii]|uniref:FAD/NAD(P)-binding domain-containing protein n=1 Tax=Phellinidium pouzarii TaxID=167371 RepID=A0A4V3XCL4_9AGAM|nr:hypothetical protein EW145_g4104 [Phellinidium pouzarii]
MQNVIVLGGSYGGARAAQLIAQGLGKNFRVIMIDRNSHASHLYVIPRMGVLPGHEHKSFIPYRGIFNPANPSTGASDVPSANRHLVLHAHVTALTSHSVTISRTFPEYGLHSPVIPYKYAVYALGSRLPAPIDLWSKDENSLVTQPYSDDPEAAQVSKEQIVKEYGGTKPEGIEWLKRCQDRIRRAGSVLCVGGGALGVQFATDIKSLYPEKHVTLLHSRHRLLPRFDYDMHSEIMKSMEDFRIDLVLGERLDLKSTLPENVKLNERGQRIVRTLKGREVAADLLLLCTGQVPNTGLIGEMSPDSIDPETKLAYVLPTMQLGVIPSEPVADDISSGLRTLSVGSSSENGYASGLELGEEDQLPDEPLPETPFPHIFVIGDSADAFGAIKAGHTAYWQGEVAARNIIRLASLDTGAEDPTGFSVESGSAYGGEEKEPLKLERYNPGPPAIKVSLGIGSKSLYEINGVIGRKDTIEADDMDAGSAWGFFGLHEMKPEDMYE